MSCVDQRFVYVDLGVNPNLTGGCRISTGDACSLLERNARSIQRKDIGQQPHIPGNGGCTAAENDESHVCLRKSGT